MTSTEWRIPATSTPPVRDHLQQRRAEPLPETYLLPAQAGSRKVPAPSTEDFSRLFATPASSLAWRLL
jgi:hypothetical protein